MDSLRGQLLIASPSLQDPNFHRTVVLVTEHTDEGAMGLVLNRPADTPVDEVAPELALLVDGDDPVYVGGPVGEEAVIVLAEFEDPSEAAAPVMGALGFVPAGADESDLAERLLRARVFAGYAGWGPGQLDGEIEEESWILEPAAIDDAFAVDVSALWSAVLSRKGAEYALLATMPPDPSVN
jgi:putative transcriptional regulator